MRVSFMLGAVVVIFIALPLIGFFFAGGLIKMASQIVLSAVLALALAGTGVFGYICVKAQARKWGTGLIVVAIICLLAILMIWRILPI